MKEQNYYARFCLLVCDDVKPSKNIALFEWIRLDSFSTATLKMDSFEKFFLNHLPNCRLLLKRKHNFNVCISVLGISMAKKLFRKIFFVN